VTTYLLDVNMLLALSDPMHVHHEVAHRWFAVTGSAAWATCPLTENGFVRIAAHPRYPNRPGDVATALEMLRRFCSSANHFFWPAEVTFRESVVPAAVFSHNHVTDVYLLGLAVHHGGKLATLDQHIPVTAVKGGASALELIRP
jgi:uncharacterized protein